MVVFAIATDKNKTVDQFIKETNKRFKSSDVTKNPFIAKIFKVSDDLFIFDMKPIYPNISPLGVLGVISVYIFWGFSLLMIPPLVIASTHFLFTKYFYYGMLRFGLSKAGYNGKVKLVRLDKALIEVLGNGAKGNN